MDQNYCFVCMKDCNNKICMQCECYACPYCWVEYLEKPNDVCPICKTNEILNYKKDYCKVCGFNPFQFEKEVPNLRQLLLNNKLFIQESKKGGLLENWRGSLSYDGLCWTCAH